MAVTMTPTSEASGPDAGSACGRTTCCRMVAATTIGCVGTGPRLQQGLGRVEVGLRVADNHSPRVRG